MRTTSKEEAGGVFQLSRIDINTFRGFTFYYGHSYYQLLLTVKNISLYAGIKTVYHELYERNSKCPYLLYRLRKFYLRYKHLTTSQSSLYLEHFFHLANLAQLLASPAKFMSKIISTLVFLSLGEHWPVE